MAPDHAMLTAWLTRLRLTAVRDQLDSLLDEAARKELTLREAVGLLCERKIARREDRRIKMARKIAHFPTVLEPDGFDFAAQPAIDPRICRELAACRWVAHGDALLLARLCSAASSLLWRGLTSHARASSASAPRLPDADQ